MAGLKKTEDPHKKTGLFQGRLMRSGVVAHEDALPDQSLLQNIGFILKRYSTLLGHRCLEDIFSTVGTKIQRHGNRRGSLLERDELGRMMREIGRGQWKKESNYSRRSLAETAVYWFKMLFEVRFISRKFDCQADEVVLKCNLLNMMIVPKVL